jgi:hypothetical protein
MFSEPQLLLKFLPPFREGAGGGTPSLDNDIAIRIFYHGNRPPPPGVFSTESRVRRLLEMGLLFYLTLFIVMCVFGWSVKGG